MMMMMMMMVMTREDENYEGNTRGARKRRRWDERTKGRKKVALEEKVGVK